VPRPHLLQPMIEATVHSVALEGNLLGDSPDRDVLASLGYLEGRTRWSRLFPYRSKLMHKHEVPMTLTQSTPYTHLRQSIQATLSEGHLRAQKAVERERVVTYWAVGDLLVEFLDANPKEYGAQVMKQLAADVGLSERTLYYIVRFRRLLPKLKSISILSWTHYLKLLAVSDKGKRARLLSEAETRRWTVRELSLQIAAGAQGGREQGGKVATKESTPLVAKRGEPYLYRLMEKPQIGLVLDQGFRTFTLPHRSLPSDAKPGDVFRSVKATSGYRLEPYNKVRRVWSYVATVIRVVDGDTVWVTLDTGFGDYVDQNLRLRGIDTPEMDTAKGRKAKDFVVNAIGNVKRIIVSTTKVDKYDRYLADILYVEEDVADVYEIAKKGTYLNRQLISDGLAERYVE